MTETNSAQDTLSPEQQQLQEQFNFHAAMAFGEQPPTLINQPESTSPIPSTVEQPIKPTVEQPSEEEIVEPNVWLKNTFGWDSEDIAKAELAELRKLKESQPTSQHQFANEQSKTIYELFAKGEVSKAIEAYQTQEKINTYTTGEVTKEVAPEIIKMGIYMNSGKRLSPEEVDFQYKQDYGIPKEPVYNELKETEDEFKERHDEWKDRVANIEMKKIVAAKMAIPQLEQLKATVQLQSINTPQTTVDDEYEAWKASNAKSSEDYQKVTVPAINALKAADLQASIKVDDPKNQMQFEVSITPDDTDFNEAKSNSLDVMGWLSKTCYDEKGNFNANRLARAILLEKNFDKYAQSIARQAVNAERARYVTRNAGGGLVRDFNTNPQQLTQLQQEAERAFAV